MVLVIISSILVCKSYVHMLHRFMFLLFLHLYSPIRATRAEEGRGAEPLTLTVFFSGFEGPPKWRFKNFDFLPESFGFQVFLCLRIID